MKWKIIIDKVILNLFEILKRKNIASIIFQLKY
jgi:hypothetical protein